MKKRCFAFLTGLLIGITRLLAQTAADLPAEPALLIVDSTVTDNLGYLPPEDIESITVLKGKEAIARAALFGKSGTGGVLLIKTKDPRQTLPAEAYLSLYKIKLTPYSVLMLDDRLIADPWRLRIDTSQIVQVTRSVFDGLSYLDSASRNLQLIKIYTKRFDAKRPAEVPVKKTPTPYERYQGFKNLQTIRSAGSRLIYMQRYWSSNGKKSL
ncbi:hypothetical protein [Niabella drilacis]|uniref:TonB-dependent outer membrane receptor, SusC/RagA subfamily, signature region n=1 Tax=Niabella drilacis (strain DSM 25811 / CCM 8410 / CCUG 62505 / LMG 26954 / E90) TaxID=1285928 RepID=A0A1G6IRQ2_NIADE|nr:hypothetical protein [Niabella drilacis]SDC09177.1 hypothetical protein SAMN04487894_101309 [Niabella drilacis]